MRRVGERRDAVRSTDLQTQEINAAIGEILPKTAAEVGPFGDDLGYANLPVLNQQSYTLVKGIESDTQPGGYKGRAGIYETITVDEDIQKLIIAHATSADIMNVAKMKGTVTMRQDGFLKALTGLTTLEEVNRVASDLA